MKHAGRKEGTIAAHALEGALESIESGNSTINKGGTQEMKEHGKLEGALAVSQPAKGAGADPKQQGGKSRTQQKWVKVLLAAIVVGAAVGGALAAGGSAGGSSTPTPAVNAAGATPTPAPAPAPAVTIALTSGLAGVSKADFLNPTIQAAYKQTLAAHINAISITGTTDAPAIQAGDILISNVRQTSGGALVFDIDITGSVNAANVDALKKKINELRNTLIQDPVFASRFKDELKTNMETAVSNDSASTWSTPIIGTVFSEFDIGSATTVSKTRVGSAAVTVTLTSGS